MATHRADGYPHLTPIWFVWEDGQFKHTLGANRVHLANLARDPRMSLVIDEDYRLADGLAAGARSVTVRGDAVLSQDPELIRDVTYKALVKYLGAERRRALPRADHGRGPHDRDDDAHGLGHLGLQQGRLELIPE